MKRFAFIFARGGSKGLPNKNIKPLLGKPLIQYSIQSALSCAVIDDIFVSTDSEQIANVAEKHGASIICRPNSLASDTSPEWLSWQHAISWVRERHDDFDEFISLPATSPLRTVKDIEDAIEKRISVGADVCVSMTAASRSPYFNMLKESDGFVSVVLDSQCLIGRRQDAPKVYDMCTSVYVSTPDYICSSEHLFSGKVTAICVPKNRSIDIDDLYDFKLAELIMKGELNE